jgi:hypothetical protein
MRAHGAHGPPLRRGPGRARAGGPFGLEILREIETRRPGRDLTGQLEGVKRQC